MLTAEHDVRPAGVTIAIHDASRHGGIAGLDGQSCRARYADIRTLLLRYIPHVDRVGGLRLRVAMCAGRRSVTEKIHTNTRVVRCGVRRALIAISVAISRRLKALCPRSGSRARVGLIRALYESRDLTRAVSQELVWYGYIRRLANIDGLAALDEYRGQMVRYRNQPPQRSLFIPVHRLRHC